MRLLVFISLFSFYASPLVASEWGNCAELFGSFKDVVGKVIGAEKKRPDRKKRTKDFNYTISDALRESDSVTDLPSQDDLLDISRHLTISEFNALKFMDEKLRFTYGFRVVKLDGMPSPTEIQYSENIRGR